MKELLKKISLARLAFQNSGIKPKGENKFAGYKYYELADILPITNKINDEIGLLSVISFDKDLATCEVFDTETGKSIKFTSPMSAASLKGCHEVQNLGAVETYIKRYLYQNVYEIVENDVLDAILGEDKKADNKEVKKAKPLPPLEEEKYNPINNQANIVKLIDKTKVTSTDIRELIEKKFGNVKANNLNEEQYNKLIEEIKKLIRERKNET